MRRSPTLGVARSGAGLHGSAARPGDAAGACETHGRLLRLIVAPSSQAPAAAAMGCAGGSRFDTEEELDEWLAPYLDTWKVKVRGGRDRAIIGKNKIIFYTDGNTSVTGGYHTDLGGGGGGLERPAPHPGALQERGGLEAPAAQAARRVPDEQQCVRGEEALAAAQYEAEKEAAAQKQRSKEGVYGPSV